MYTAKPGISAKCSWQKKPKVIIIDAGVTLTQISAHITHKNVGARKIMEAMRTACEKSGTSQNELEANDHWRVFNVKGKRASFANNILFG